MLRSPRCDLTSNAEHFVRKQVSDVVVEAGTLGVGPQQGTVGPEGNTGILMRGSVAEPHLKNRSKAIVSYFRQRRGRYFDRVHDSHRFRSLHRVNLFSRQVSILSRFGFDGFRPVRRPGGSIRSALSQDSAWARSHSESGAGAKPNSRHSLRWRIPRENIAPGGNSTSDPH
jgi:hypothetical protein